jgi:MYXO-CTERM domain-containing protein
VADAADTDDADDADTDDADSGDGDGVTPGDGDCGEDDDCTVPPVGLEDDDMVVTGGGCGCGASEPGTLAALAGLVLAYGARRRARHAR